MARTVDGNVCLGVIFGEVAHVATIGGAVGDDKDQGSEKIGEMHDATGTLPESACGRRIARGSVDGEFTGCCVQKMWLRLLVQQNIGRALQGRQHASNEFVLGGRVHAGVSGH